MGGNRVRRTVSEPPKRNAYLIQTQFTAYQNVSHHPRIILRLTVQCSDELGIESAADME